MTDRELLEAAAKAAGMNAPEFESTHDGRYWVPAHGFWNPLTDDGDALRLQVDLGINLDFRAQRVRAYADEVPGAMEEEYGRDKRAATRRAIVRAAAAIGGAQP